MAQAKRVKTIDRIRLALLIPLYAIFLIVGCGHPEKTLHQCGVKSKFTMAFSPGSSMQSYFSRARYHKKAYLGDDKIEYPTCLYSKKPTIRDFSCAEKEKLRQFVQDVINEYVSYLYGRYSFDVRHVTLVNIMEHGLPCTDTYYGKVDSLRLKPMRLVMDPTTGYAGYAGSVNLALHYRIATAPDFMVDWSPGPGLGYYESTSAVVRHELGHCFGLHHESNVPSAVYGINHSQNKHRIFGDDINGITHIWRAFKDPDYKQDCPKGYKKSDNLGPNSGSHFPKDWGCLPDIEDYNLVRIKNKDTGKCLYYSDESEGVIVKQAACDREALNQRWNVHKHDNYGRHRICVGGGPLLCIRSEDLSNAQNAKMVLGYINEAYSPWYLVPNEDDSYMFQQPEAYQVMYASSASVTDEVIKQRKPLGDDKERWFVKEIISGINNQRIYYRNVALTIPANGMGPITNTIGVKKSLDDIPVDRCEIIINITHPREEDLRIEFLHYYEKVISLKTVLHQYGSKLRDVYHVPNCELSTALGDWVIAVYDKGPTIKGKLDSWSLTINKVK